MSFGLAIPLLLCAWAFLSRSEQLPEPLDINSPKYFWKKIEEQPPEIKALIAQYLPYESKHLPYTSSVRFSMPKRASLSLWTKLYVYGFKNFVPPSNLPCLLSSGSTSTYIGTRINQNDMYVQKATIHSSWRPGYYSILNVEALSTQVIIAQTFIGSEYVPKSLWFISKTVLLVLLRPVSDQINSFNEVYSSAPHELHQFTIEDEALQNNPGESRKIRQKRVAADIQSFIVHPTLPLVFLLKHDLPNKCAIVYAADATCKTFTQKTVIPFQQGLYKDSWLIPTSIAYTETNNKAALRVFFDEEASKLDYDATPTLAIPIKYKKVP